MSRILVLVDSQNQENPKNDGFDKTIRLRTRTSKEADISLTFTEIRPALPDYLSYKLFDLLTLAAVCYEIDEHVKRGGITQVFEEGWTNRHIVVRFPVANPQHWHDFEVLPKLQKYLEYLTGNTWEFEIESVMPEGIQGSIFHSFENPGTDLQGIDAVSLFSGGLDSLVGAVHLANSGKRIALASHCTIGNLGSKQRKLFRSLSENLGSNSLVHVPFRSQSRSSLQGAKEGSRRVRGFVYHSLALAVALGCGTNNIFVPENGIVAINLAYRAQGILAKNSRASHPKTLNLFQEFARAFTQQDIQVSNPLRFDSRIDTINMLKDSHLTGLINQTVSCSSTRIVHQQIPHCGTCSQCIDRRFSLEAANLNVKDLFKKDIFLEPLEKKNYEARMAALDYVEAAKKFKNASLESFIQENPDIHDVLALDIEHLEKNAEAYYSMYNRHSNAVLQVMENQISAANLASSEVPDNSLVRLVAGRRGQQVSGEFIEGLVEVVRDGLMRVPCWPDIKDEKELQGYIEMILQAKWGDFHREMPMLPFAGFGFKPDFSTSKKDELFIEVKYPRKTRPARDISHEISADLAAAEKNGVSILFLVVDPHYAIRDREVFIKDLSFSGNCWLRIIS